MSAATHNVETCPPQGESPDRPECLQDVGYSVVRTGEDWPTLLAKVREEVPDLTAAEEAELRAGWEAAQADVESWDRDMAAGRDLDRTTAYEDTGIPY